MGIPLAASCGAAIIAAQLVRLYNYRVKIESLIDRYKPSHRMGQRGDGMITTLVIHHDAGRKPPTTRAGVLTRLDSYYTNHDGHLPYHYVIDLAGNVYKCNPTDRITHHARFANRNGIGIMLMGYFHPPYNEQPTPAQLASCKALVAELRGALPGIRRVLGHRQIPGASTACPGDLMMPHLPGIGGTAPPN